ncbi:MAG: AMP-dependent synthetase [Microbacterium sp.]|uniref:class I adenylate-forming enzyme family protein n=1 Tax=uncultured Microbacterium sp. TaxID=191216 RepID=UPI000C9298EA|nr:AMP-binding protein [uncultured Microbacterium sp.]MAL06895.1 AMP-dependent synthetase [Microbacterium sp.]
MPTSLYTEARVIEDVVDHAADAWPDRIAVRDRSRALTFAELRDRSRRLADGLLRSGLRRGDRVLEALPNGVDLLLCELALAAAGLVRVPLNPRLGPREWHGILADSGARGMVVDRRLCGADGQPIADRIGAEITIRVDAGGLESLVAGGADWVRATSTPDEVVGLAYSSGTTGMPKGAIRTHRMRLASMRAMLRDVLAPTGEVGAYLHAGPAIHTSGLFTLPMLALGAPQVMVDHATPADIAGHVADHSITHLALVPSVIDALTALPEQGRRAFAGVRMLAYAGSPMPATQIRRAAERLTPRLVQYYGLVEAMPPLSVLSIDDLVRGLAGEHRLLLSAGHVIQGADIRIEDGAPGEVTVSGPMVTPGYWNASDRSDLGKSFCGERLRTGDIGRLEDGILFLTDRRNDMLISGGYNVYPSEIEAAVAPLRAIRDAIAVGLPDERWGQRIVLAYTTASGAELTEADREALDEALTALTKHKRPKSLHRFDSLPLGATGKISRRAVVDLLTTSKPLTPERH